MMNNLIYSGQWYDLDCRPRVSKQEKKVEKKTDINKKYIKSIQIIK